MRSVLGFYLAVLLIANQVPSVSAAAEQAGVMGKARAGEYYMKQACTYVAAAERFDRVVLKGRDYISQGEIRRRLPEVKRAVTRLGNTTFAVSRNLLMPPKDWPDEVTKPVEKLGKAIRAQAEHFRAAGRAKSAVGFIRQYRKAKYVYFGDWGKKIRVRLDLPPPAEWCTSGSKRALYNVA